MRIFGTDKKDWGFYTDIETLAKNMHYISRLFNTLVLEPREQDSIEDFTDFINKYKRAAKVWVKLPSSVDVMNLNSPSYIDSTVYLRKMLEHSGSIEGVIFDLAKYDKSNNTKFGFQDAFLTRVTKTVSRIGMKLILVNGETKKNKSNQISVADLINIKKSTKTRICLNLYNSQIYGDNFIGGMKQLNGLSGLVRNFDMILLSAANNKGEEVTVTCSGDVYGVGDYAAFLKEFKNIPVVYRGTVDEVIPVHTKLLEAYGNI